MSIQSFFLNNGLKVVLKENHSSPVISFNALVKVGSAHETDKEAGMSHVIEHMLFKGTPTRPVGAIAKEVEAAGGEINAYPFLNENNTVSSTGINAFGENVNPGNDVDVSGSLVELGIKQETITDRFL